MRSPDAPSPDFWPNGKRRMGPRPDEDGSARWGHFPFWGDVFFFGGGDRRVSRSLHIGTQGNSHWQVLRATAK